MARRTAKEEQGLRIRRLREDRGFTQAYVAKRANITVPYLSQIENGARTGTQQVLSRLARSLGVSTSTLVGETEAPVSPLEEILGAGRVRLMLKLDPEELRSKVDRIIIDYLTE